MCDDRSPGRPSTCSSGPRTIHGRMLVIFIGASLATPRWLVSDVQYGGIVAHRVKGSMGLGRSHRAQGGSVPGAYSHQPDGYVCPFCRVVAGEDVEGHWTKQADVVWHDDLATAFIAASW